MCDSTLLKPPPKEELGVRSFNTLETRRLKDSTKGVCLCFHDEDTNSRAQIETGQQLKLNGTPCFCGVVSHSIPKS